MKYFKFVPLCLLLPAIAQAHVMLEQPTAPAHSSYKAALLVMHGCDGSPTTRVTITIPEEIVLTKPMPKPGWSVETKMEKLAKPFTLHGKSIGERISEVTWSGGSLADSHFDEFVVFVGLTEPGKRYFRVAQTCEKGQLNWNQIPEEGKSLHDYATPAAVLEVTLVTDQQGHHKH